MCLLLEINVLSGWVHFALIIGGCDVSRSVTAQVKLNPHKYVGQYWMWGGMCHVFHFGVVGVTCFRWYTGSSKWYAELSMWHLVYQFPFHYLQMQSPEWRVRVTVPLPFPEWITQIIHLVHCIMRYVLKRLILFSEWVTGSIDIHLTTGKVPHGNTRKCSRSRVWCFWCRIFANVNSIQLFQVNIHLMTRVTEEWCWWQWG